MIGAARCNSSADNPIPDIRSGSARTTTYVSAAANATAIDASVSWALGRAATAGLTTTAW